MVMSTHGEGSRFGPGSGGEPDGGRNARVLISRYIEEIEGVFCASPYPIRAKVRFALDLLYRQQGVSRNCLHEL